jgi:hypothetical protein
MVVRVASSIFLPYVLMKSISYVCTHMHLPSILPTPDLVGGKSYLPVYIGRLRRGLAYLLLFLFLLMTGHDDMVAYGHNVSLRFTFHNLGQAWRSRLPQRVGGF